MRAELSIQWSNQADTTAGMEFELMKAELADVKADELHSAQGAKKKAEQTAIRKAPSPCPELFSSLPQGAPILSALFT